MHRAVAELFIPNPDNKPCIDHIDDNKLNNRVDNLRWVTYSENNGKPSHIEKQSKTLKERELGPEWKEHVGDAVRKWWAEKEHHSEETRKKMSEIKTEWWKNHIISEEEHKMRSESQKGKKMPEEYKKRLSERIKGENHPLYGKHHSEETKKKLSERRKEYYKTHEPANKGIPCSEEQKRKQSEKMKGRHRVYHDDGTFHYEK